MSAFEPRLVNTNDQEVTVWDFFNGDNHVRRLLGASETAGRLSFFESVLAPGFVVNAHIHREEDEYWYMIDEGIEVLLNDRRLPVAAGSVVAIPAGALHEIKNVGPSSARSVFFTTPGGLEHFFAGLDQLLRSGASPDQLAAHFEKTGTTFPQGLDA